MADKSDKPDKTETDSRETRENSLVTETIKKVFAIGTTAAFLTEESVKKYLDGVKLPKEILNLVIESANKSKDEISNRVGKEMITIIQKIDFVKEISRFAETHKFKITAEVEISKKEEPK